jgi:hypothetical protein
MTKGGDGDAWLVVGRANTKCQSEPVREKPREKSVTAEMIKKWREQT